MTTGEIWVALVLAVDVAFRVIALVIGCAAGFAALLFRKGINLLQATLYGTEDTARLHSFAETLAWYWILLIPIAGGLIVGVILNRFAGDDRVRGVADVIEGAALHDGRVEAKAGLASAAASLITLSSGGSTGREGPVVHLGAMISTWVSNRINADGITGRDLLGCAVAAAVSRGRRRALRSLSSRVRDRRGLAAFRDGVAPRCPKRRASTIGLPTSECGAYAEP